MILDQYGDPIKIERKSLAAEIANWQTATGATYNILPDPDPVLYKRGDDAQVLDGLAADDQVTMAMQLRKRKVTNKGAYDYAPGQPDKGNSASKGAVALCRGLTMDLAAIKLKPQFNAMLAAPFYGYSVIELYWAVDGGRMKLAHMEEKPRTWFCFDGDGRLCFLENGQKRPVPYGKFLLIRHEPTYENPYGLRLLSRCLWPVAFKRSGVEWCNRFLERYGMAWQVAKAPAQYTEAQRRTLASSLAAMVQDAVAVLPQGAEHEIVKVDSKGGAEGFIAFLNFWNASISKVLSCQTQSSEITGSTGTYASSKTHYEVLEDVVQADEQLVCDAMNDLAVIYARVNGSGEYPPVFSFIEAEDHIAQAELDEKRYAVGVRFSKAHFERQGLAPEEFDLVEGPGGQNTEPGGQDQARNVQPQEPDTPSDHAAPQFTPDQQALEDLADQGIDKAMGGVDGFQKELLACVDQADSFDDLIMRLQAAFAGAGAGEFEDILSQAMTAAQMFGRFRIIEEGGI